MFIMNFILTKIKIKIKVLLELIYIDLMIMNKKITNQHSMKINIIQKKLDMMIYINKEELNLNILYKVLMKN